MLSETCNSDSLILNGRCISDTVLSLSWSTFRGATSYRIYQDSIPVQDVFSGNTCRIEGMSAGHSAYSFYVEALDENGQVLAHSATLKLAAVHRVSVGNGSNFYMPAYQGKLRVPVSDLAASLDFIGPATADPNYHYWCTSVVHAPEDGRFHMFTSRVPSSVGFTTGWRTDCEIAHFVSDSPEGPFQESEVIFDNSYFLEKYNLPCASPHNSRITLVDDTYCLLFIVQCSGTQSTCMAISKSVYGPWTIQDGGDHTGILFKAHEHPELCQITNPDILKIGSKYHIYFKAKKYGFFQFFLATADSLTGPYFIHPDPVTENEHSVEDINAFEWNGKYYFLGDDNFGDITGVNAAGILWTSRDGLSLKKTDALMGFADLDEYIQLPEGCTNSYGYDFPHNEYAKHERPCLLMLDGKPAYFYAPSGVSIDGNNACQNYIYRVGILPKYPVTQSEVPLHGKLSFSLSLAYQTQDVAIHISPEPGWELSSLRVTDCNGSPVELTKDLIFAMPRGGADVQAIFASIS